MKRFKKLVSVLTLTAMLAASLTACGGKDPVAEDDSTAGTTTADSSTATTETSGDSTFTYAISGDPTETVNVITTSDRWGLSTVKMIYSPLYMNNADGINWFLATDYSVSDDNLTYTFKLRDDVKWSDGEPFTADDVVFTYEAMEQEDNLGWAYSQLVYDQGTVKVEKVDDYTVSFTFPFVTPTAIEMLSQIFIMPEHIYKDVTDFEHNDYNMNSVGTGPYKLVDYQSGSYLKFEANENYYKGEPSIKNVVCHPYTRALLASIPIADPKRALSLEHCGIEGDLPSPLHVPSGCRFHTRCPYATDQCRQQEPELEERTPGHMVACWKK